MNKTGNCIIFISQIKHTHTGDKPYTNHDPYHPFRIDETKINEMYTWSVEFYKKVTTSIEIHLSLALEEQLYILKV